MPQTIGGQTLLSTAEAHDRSGLSQRHIGWLAHQGQIDGFRLGRMWLIYAESLQRYLDQPHKPGPKGPRASS